MKKFAVFDIDGTLVRWQLYHAIVDRLAKMGLLGHSAQEDIHHARMKWKRREHAQEFKAYEQALITIFEQALDTLKPSDFDKAVDEIIDEYKDQSYTFTRQLIQKLKTEDYMLLAISGSQAELVSKVAKHYGFDDYAATQYQRDGAMFTGQKFIASHDKKTALEQLIAKHNLVYTNSYAVGDSSSDSPMLEMVEHPIAFNPDAELFNQARLAGWQIVIERKNVVYTLDQRRDKYVLA